MPDIFLDKKQQKRRDEVTSEETPKINHHLGQTQHVPHKLGMLSTFVRHPMGVELAEQHENEHILLFIRRDFITQIPWIFSTLIFALIPFFIPWFLQFLNLSLDFIPPSILTILVIFYYLVILGFAFAYFITWFYDIGIVTEERAVDIDFYNISFVSVATARAQDLKDVRYAQRGFFESFFDYGNVTMVVEASGETLTFENAPRPSEIVSILSSLIGGHQE